MASATLSPAAEFLKNLTHGEDWAGITGTRAAGGIWNSSANRAANARLRQELRAKNYRFWELRGVCNGVADGPSFLVSGITRRDAEILRDDYDQDSVLTVDGLLHADGRVTPPAPELDLIGPDALAADYHSVLPDGTAFSMGLDFTRQIALIGYEG